jgi:hypothetical protein
MPHPFQGSLDVRGFSLFTAFSPDGRTRKRGMDRPAKAFFGPLVSSLFPNTLTDKFAALKPDES